MSLTRSCHIKQTPFSSLSKSTYQSCTSPILLISFDTEVLNFSMFSFRVIGRFLITTALNVLYDNKLFLTFAFKLLDNNFFHLLHDVDGWFDSPNLYSTIHLYHDLLRLPLVPRSFLIQAFHQKLIFLIYSGKLNTPFYFVLSLLPGLSVIILFHLVSIYWNYDFYVIYQVHFRIFS